MNAVGSILNKTYYAVTVPDPAHFDADPDPDFYFMRMQIRMWTQVTKMVRVYADPDPDPQHCYQQVKNQEKPPFLQFLCLPNNFEEWCTFT
jgi:hypothetical protein